MALILASTSAIRRQMLDAAGVDYEAVKPGVDESAVKARLSDAVEIASSWRQPRRCSLAATIG